MAKLFLDLKRMKKTKDDGKTAVFQHEQGHEIHVKHGSLTPGMRAQLESLKLGKGGKDKGPTNPKLAELKKEPQKMAEGGAVGGYPPCKNPSCPSHGKPHPNCRCYGMAEGGMAGTHKDQCPYSVCQRFADGGEVSLPNLDPNAAPQPSASANTTLNLPPEDPGNRPYGTPDAPTASQDAPQAPPQGMPAPTPSGAPPPSPTGQPGAPDTFGANAYADALGAGIQEQKAGNALGAQAEGALGQEQAAALHNQVNMQQELQKHYVSHYADLESERQNFMHDVQNHLVDPNHYMNSLDTGQKVSSAIGLILGGIGSGITGRENPAMAFLNNQIDRDINAQKTNLGSRENLLSANLKQFGNLRDATDMTRVMSADIVSNQLKEAAAKAQDPLAKARALAAAGEIDQKYAPVMSQIAMRRSLSSAGNQNVEQVPQMIQQLKMMGNEPMAKYYEERFVPGVGVAQAPVTPADRDRLVGFQAFQQKAQNLLDFAQRHKNTVLDRKTVNEGKALAAEVQGSYRQATHGGVYKEGEQHFINSIVGSDPTAFFNETRFQGPLKAVMQSQAGDQNTLHKSLGLPQVQGAHPHEGKVAVGPGGAKLIMQGGKWVPYGR